MIDTSVSQLVNEVDKSDFTLYAEWQDTHFKIILLRSHMVPLRGEMNTGDANYFLDHLGESLDVYMEKTKQAFSGENVEILFFLQNETFTWMQQNILTRGKIILEPISNILTIADILKQVLERYRERQKQLLAFEKENGHLNKTNTKLIADIEAMISLKNNMEKDLYCKFLLLLNTKKEKIRELQEALNNNKHVTKSKYDETTEESEESDVNTEKMDINRKSMNTKKRKIDYNSESETILKNIKKNFKEHIDFSSSDESPVASTSKDKSISRDTDICDIIRSRNLNIPEEESEEDLFSS